LKNQKAVFFAFNKVMQAMFYISRKYLMETPGKNKNLFERFSNAATKFTGSSSAFIIALLTVVVRAVTGPVFKYSQMKGQATEW